MNFIDSVLNVWQRALGRKRSILKVGDLVTYDGLPGTHPSDPPIPMTIIDIFPMTGALNFKWTVAHVILPNSGNIDIVDTAYLKRWDEQTT